MVIFILLLIVWIYIFIFDHPSCDVIELPDADFKYKIGDVILFHALDNLLPLCIGTYYTHAAVVISENHMFEAINPQTNNIKGNGVLICEIEQRLRTYRGYVYIKRVNRDVKWTQEMNNFVNYSIQNCYYNVDIFRNFVEKVVFGEPITHGFNCGELVYLSLIALEILDKKKFTSNRKHHLLWIVNMKKNYLPIKRIEYNAFITPRDKVSVPCIQDKQDK